VARAFSAALRSHALARQFVGSSLALLCTVGALVSRDRSAHLLMAAPVFGYGFAWFSHFVYEKNHPASWTWPLWSFMVRCFASSTSVAALTRAFFCQHGKGDVKMYKMILLGQMEAEVQRLQALPRGAPIVGAVQ